MPPYAVKETGYGSFVLSIEVFFNTTEKKFKKVIFKTFLLLNSFDVFSSIATVYAFTIELLPYR